MKKLFFIIALFVTGISFGQTVQKRIGIDPVSGRSGYIFNDTIYSVPQVAAFYFNGYGNFVSLRDTVRSYFSVAKSPLSYSAGVFDFDTTTHHSYAYYQTVFGSGGGSSSLSGLTAATANNTINNLAYKQTWNWNSLANDTGFIINSVNTASTGNNQVLFAVASAGTNAAFNDTTTTVVFSNKHTGSGNSSNIAARFIASGATGQNTAASFEGSWVGGHVRIGKLNQAGNIYFVRGDGAQLATQVATVGFLSATESTVFQIAGSNGGGQVRLAATDITFYNLGSEIARFSGAKLGLGLSPTMGLLNFKANTTTIPAIFFTSGGSLTTTPISGTMEYINSGFHQTNGGSLRYGMGGTVATFYTDSSNTGTSETDLNRYTFPLNSTNATGMSIDAFYSGTFTVASTTTLKVYFAGQQIASTGGMTISAAGNWIIRVNIIYPSGTAARCTTTITSTSSSLPSYVNYYETTGTITGIPELKISATSSGSTGDIVSKLGKITFTSSAN